MLFSFMFSVFVLSLFMFSRSCFPVHVFHSCFPVHVFPFMFPCSCFPVHVFPFMFPCSCFPVHVSLFMFSRSCFPVHVFPFMFPCSCFPVHVSLFMFSPRFHQQEERLVRSANSALAAFARSCGESSSWEPILPPLTMTVSCTRAELSILVTYCFFMPTAVQPPLI